MLRVIAAVLCSVVFAGCAHAETEWRVRASEGLDAVLFVGALSGDKLQGEQYPEEIKKYRALLTPEEIAALDRINGFFAVPGRGLAGPSFAYSLVAAPDQSYAGVGEILREPEAFLAENFGHKMGAGERQGFADYYTAYAALDRIGFIDDWRANALPKIEAAIALFEAFLAPYDLITLHEKYLGRDLDDEIEVVILHYNKPYGIRVAGQRFATFHGWSEDTTLQTAAHEIFHPPFDADSAELAAAAGGLKSSALMSNIVAKADPKWGYSSFESVLDEDSTQALDMVLSLQIGKSRDPAEYWRAQDNGMHILAAAIFDAMNETGFAETGGVYEDWLIDALQGEILSPASVERRARRLLGDEAIDKWAE